MCFWYWVPKATDTHSQYVILMVFHYNNGCKNTPIVTLYVQEHADCYAVRTRTRRLLRCTYKNTPIVTLYAHCLSCFFWDALVGLLILPSGTSMLTRNVGHQQPTDPVQPLRREMMLATQQRQPKDVSHTAATA